MNAERSRRLRTVAALALYLAVAVPAGRAGQGEELVGFVSRDRVCALAGAADGSFAAFTPSPVAQASLVALIDPVHVRMFLLTSRPDDLRYAAAVSKAFEAAGNAALSVEFIGVAKDLSEPADLISESGVKEVPGVIVYWLGTEVGRYQPTAGVVAEEELAAFIHQARTQVAQDMLFDRDFFRNVFHKDLPIDCTRCHLAGRRPGRP